MRVVTLGKSNDSTIISGVMDLWSSGMYPIAIVVFVASILVPVMKFVAMIYLLLVVQLKQTRRARQCTVLYRLVEFVGRWSMVDVFVVALTCRAGANGCYRTNITGYRRSGVRCCGYLHDAGGHVPLTLD